MIKEHERGGHAQDVTAESIQFPDEIAHLKDISRDIDDALADAEANVRRLDKEYMDMQRSLLIIRENFWTARFLTVQ